MSVEFPDPYELSLGGGQPEELSADGIDLTFAPRGDLANRAVGAAVFREYRSDVAAPEAAGAPEAVQLPIAPLGMWQVDMHHTTRDLSTAVTRSLVWSMRDTLVHTLAADPRQFDPDAVVVAMQNRVSEDNTTVVDRVLDAELQRSLPGDDRPINRAVEQLLGSPVSDEARPVSPDAAYLDSLRGEVAAERDTLAALPELVGRLDGPVLDLAQQVHAVLSRESGPDIDEAYRLVVEASQHIDQYALDASNRGALYLFSLWPRDARRLVLPLVSAATVTAEAYRQLALTGEQDTAMVEAIRTCLVRGSISGYVWEEMATKGSCSDAVRRQLTMATVSHFEAIEEAEAIAARQEPHAKAGMRAWNDAAVAVDRAVTDTGDYYDRLAHWQTTDVGHCFTGFLDLSLMYRLEDTLVAPRSRPPKDGSRAIILDDDPTQLAAWQGIVERHTPHATTPDGVLTQPEAVRQFLTDPNVGLYVLDIEDGVGGTAGIDIAEQLLVRRLDAERQGVQLPTQRVVVWSASHQAATAAVQRLQSLVDELAEYPGVGVMVQQGISRSSLRDHFQIMIGLKGSSLLAKLTRRA